MPDDATESLQCWLLESWSPGVVGACADVHVMCWCADVHMPCADVLMCWCADVHAMCWCADACQLRVPDDSVLMCMPWNIELSLFLWRNARWRHGGHGKSSVLVPGIFGACADVHVMCWCARWQNKLNLLNITYSMATLIVNFNILTTLNFESKNKKLMSNIVGLGIAQSVKALAGLTYVFAEERSDRVRDQLTPRNSLSVRN